MQNFHPLFVHFPIALLLAAWLLTVLGMLWRRETLHRAATWNLALGALGAALAAWTGVQGSRTVTPHNFEIHEIMELHERLGLAVAWGAAALVAWRALRRRAWPAHRAEQLGQAALLTVIVGCLTYGAYLGGRMVYEYGVGTNLGAQSAIDVEDSHPHSHHD